MKDTNQNLDEIIRNAIADLEKEGKIFENGFSGKAMAKMHYGASAYER